MKKETKNLKKMVGYGILVVLPFIILFSILLAEWGLPDTLAIFLNVVLSGGVILIYYWVFTFLEKRKMDKIKNNPDPFSD